LYQIAKSDVQEYANQCSKEEYTTSLTKMIFQKKNLTRFWQIWRGTRVFKFLLQKTLLRETLHVRKLLC